MATKKQLDANRRNAAKSTGPKTSEGKARSARNALKHGLRSSLAIIPGESPKDYEALYEALRNDYQPTDSVEEILVREIAVAEWRLQRFHRAEAALFWREMNHVTHYAGHGAPDPDDPYQATSDNELDSYCLAYAFSSLIANYNKPTSFARYETSIRNSLYKAIQTLEARRVLHQRTAQIPAPTKIAQAKPIRTQPKKNQQFEAPKPLPPQPAATAHPDPGRRKAS